MYNTEPCLVSETVEFKKMIMVNGQYVRPNKYLISNNGDILNLHAGIIMKPELSQSGHKDPVTGKRGASYYRVTLDLVDGNRKKFLVHRLVAEYFCPNDDPSSKIYVDHLNDIKTDNRANNLEWVTPKENAIRSYDRGTSYTRGSNCHFAEYTDDQVHQICKLLEQGKGPLEIIMCMNLMTDADKCPWYHPERKRLTSYIKKLRSGTFRKDITRYYNLKSSTTISRAKR